MKLITPLLFIMLAVGAVAQSPVPVSSTDKLAIEKAYSSLLSLQAQANTIQNTYNSQMANLKWSFGQANSSYTNLIDSAKKKLSLPDNAQFDLSTFSFTVPMKAPVDPPKDPATPKTADATPAPKK